MKIQLLFSTVVFAVGMNGSAYAQDYRPLFDFIASVNNAQVTFEGKVRYDPREGTYTFYDAHSKPYRMTMDAGRKSREEVQRVCEAAGFMISRTELCTFEANGTVEIVGGNLQLSVDEVLKVEK